jgi:hypothetical protein
MVLVIARMEAGLMVAKGAGRESWKTALGSQGTKLKTGIMTA